MSTDNMLVEIIQMLEQHQHEIISCTENIDICFISESQFTKEIFIRFENYSTYYADNLANTAPGGGANIKLFEEGKYVTCDIQATIVTNKTRKQKLICPPKYNIYQDEYSTLFNKLGGHLKIGGDFNALNIPKGRKLYKAFACYGGEIVPSGLPILINFQTVQASLLSRMLYQILLKLKMTLT